MAIEKLSDYERGALSAIEGSGLDWHSAQKALRIIDALTAEKELLLDRVRQLECHGAAAQEECDEAEASLAAAVSLMRAARSVLSAVTPRFAGEWDAFLSNQPEDKVEE